MSELRCPALHYGHMAVCRSCIYTGMGPSLLCAKQRKLWEKRQRRLGLLTGDASRARE